MEYKVYTVYTSNERPDCNGNFTCRSCMGSGVDDSKVIPVALVLAGESCPEGEYVTQWSAERYKEFIEEAEKKKECACPKCDGTGSVDFFRHAMRGD